MKIRLILIGLLILIPAAPVQADLNPGSLDTGFDPGDGANSDVYVVEIQNDGKVLIGGAFTHVGGANRAYTARLNADGSLDTSYSLGFGLDDLVLDIAIQPDAKILIGGAFTKVDDVARNHIARLNADGSLDTGFNPGSGTNDAVFALALQDD